MGALFTPVFIANGQHALIVKNENGLHALILKNENGLHALIMRKTHYKEGTS